MRAHTYSTQAHANTCTPPTHLQCQHKAIEQAPVLCRGFQREHGVRQVAGGFGAQAHLEVAVAGAVGPVAALLEHKLDLKGGWQGVQEGGGWCVSGFQAKHSTTCWSPGSPTVSRPPPPEEAAARHVTQHSRAQRSASPSFVQLAPSSSLTPARGPRHLFRTQGARQSRRWQRATAQPCRPQMTACLLAMTPRGAASTHPPPSAVRGRGGGGLP